MGGGHDDLNTKCPNEVMPRDLYKRCATHPCVLGFCTLLDFVCSGKLRKPKISNCLNGNEPECSSHRLAAPHWYLDQPLLGWATSYWDRSRKGSGRLDTDPSFKSHGCIITHNTPIEHLIRSAVTAPNCLINSRTGNGPRVLSLITNFLWKGPKCLIGLITSTKGPHWLIMLSVGKMAQDFFLQFAVLLWQAMARYSFAVVGPTCI